MTDTRLRILFLVLASAMLSATIHESSVNDAPQKAPATPQEVHELSRQAAVRVETEHGVASGFLLDSSGVVLAATGLHRYDRHSKYRFSYGPDRYLAVTLDSGKSYAARLLAFDPGLQAALLRIHPEAVRGIHPLPVAGYDSSGKLVAKGESLLAACLRDGATPRLFSGFATKAVKKKRKTIGLFHSMYTRGMEFAGQDLGCPVVNLRGEALGVYYGNAYGSADEPMRTAIRHLQQLDSLMPWVETVMQQAEGLAPPSPQPLAEARDWSVRGTRPVGDAAERPGRGYHAEIEGIRIEFLTPPLIRSLEAWAIAELTRAPDAAHEAHSGILRYRPGDDFFWWQQYEGLNRAVVAIQVIPGTKKTGGAAPSFSDPLSWVFNPADRMFSPDFDRMELLDGDVEIAPLRPGRNCGRFKVHMFSREGEHQWKDSLYGCYGSYEFPAEVFERASELTLRIFLDGVAEPVTTTLEPELLRRILSDLDPSPGDDPSRS